MDWAKVFNRLLSIFFVGICFYLSKYNLFGENSFKETICLVFPLILIWFGDAVGTFTGYVGKGGNIDAETPGWLVCFMGWIILVVIPLLLYLNNK